MKEKNSINPQNFEEQELFEHYHIIVDKGQSSIRIDKFLTQRIENASRTKIQAAADAGCIRVNGRSVKPSYKIKGGDEISLLLPYPVREIEIKPENIPVEVIYEDSDCIVVNKAAGMVVHPGYGNYTGTLQNALLFHFMQNNDNSFPYLVHRIDKDTTGLIVVAKNELSQSKLAKQFYEHSIKRKYLALVWGDVKNDEGTIKGYLARSSSNRKIMAVFSEEDGIGKLAITHYKVIERFRYTTLVECELETGRTHQIRAHFKHIGHPLFCDELYGGNVILKGTTFSKYKQFVENCFKILNRQALHAYSLGFTHPTTNKFIYFEAPLPSDFSTVIEKWRNYTNQNLRYG